MYIDKKVLMNGCYYKLNLNSIDVSDPKCEDCAFYGTCTPCFKYSRFWKSERYDDLTSLNARLVEIIKGLEKDKSDLLLANKLLEAEVDIAKGNVIPGDQALEEIKKHLDDSINAAFSSTARWEIDDDGYYPYCTNCGYEPYEEYTKNHKLPGICPKCHSIMNEE